MNEIQIKTWRINDTNQLEKKTVLGHCRVYIYIYIYTHSETGSLIKRQQNLGFDTDKWSRKNGFAIQVLNKHDQKLKIKYEILD